MGLSVFLSVLCDMCYNLENTTKPENLGVILQFDASKKHGIFIYPVGHHFVSALTVKNRTRKWKRRKSYILQFHYSTSHKIFQLQWYYTVDL